MKSSFGMHKERSLYMASGKQNNIVVELPAVNNPFFKALKCTDDNLKKKY